MTFIVKERVYNLQEMYKHTIEICWTLSVHEKAVFIIETLLNDEQQQNVRS